MTDILDLIDNAIEDWSTSGDAMRWPPPGGPKITLDAESRIYLGDVDITSMVDLSSVQLADPWQAEVAERYFGVRPGQVTIRFDNTDSRFWPARSSIHPDVPLRRMVICDWFRANRIDFTAFPYLPAQVGRRPPRVSRMHRSYSARLRARRRRRRG